MPLTGSDRKPRTSCPDSARGKAERAEMRAVPMRYCAHRISTKAIPVDPELALFANDAFYLAFSEKDAAAMDRIWARRQAVVCIHPGWPALLNREAVMDSWERILSNPDAPAIVPHHARAFPMDRLVMVVCYEALGQQMLTATNLFVTEDDEVRLLHHQASLCAQPPDPEPEGSRTLQ